MPEKESISKFLKEYRQKNEESQFEFAVNIGICVEELSKLERKIANPRLETLQKIAAYTGSEVWELVYIEKDEGKEQMYQTFLDRYWNSQEHRMLEENEIFCEIRNQFEYSVKPEEYLEYEEKLNDMIVQMEKEAFWAGCEAVLQYRCVFCMRSKKNFRD